MAPKPKPIAKRFWRHVRKTDTCWLWVGANNGNGYGLIQAEIGKAWAA